MMYTNEKTVTTKSEENSKKRSSSQGENGDKRSTNTRKYKPKIQDSKYKFNTTYEPGTFSLDDEDSTSGLYGVKTILGSGGEKLKRSIPPHINIVGIDPAMIT